MSMGGGGDDMGMGGDGGFNQNFAQDSMGGMGNQGMMFGNAQSTSTQVSIPKDVSTKLFSI
jgi:S-adenosylmethionine synthetase